MSPDNPTPIIPPKVVFGLDFNRLAVVVFAITVIGVISLQWIRPTTDNTTLIGQIITLAGVVLAFLKNQETHLVVNSRMTEMLALAKNKEFAAGEKSATEAAVAKAVVVAKQVSVETTVAAVSAATEAKPEERAEPNDPRFRTPTGS